MSLSATFVDPRLPKKQRRREEDPPDPLSQMECEDSTSARKLVSYKDIVAGSNHAPYGSEFVDLDDDDDIDLHEDNITLGSLNGVPTIDFS
ncbi:hypothetical protein V6N13_125026 [Hibiscus sabdariffa]|uniref:Uncharacterized protein n=1 Tax=Hibiscus sabdariffa TaxID=183260 RepID=A0ABR2U4I4_9ROSI